MTINEACKKYELEQNKERKEQLRQIIIKYCNENQDATIPQVASKVYIEHLCGM